MTQKNEATPKYPNIKHIPEYDGQWKGEAWFSGHWYGVQVHRDLQAAERWVEKQREQGTEHPENCVICRECLNSSHMHTPPDMPDVYGPYLAFNGHTMMARTKGYSRAGKLEYEQFSAWCASGCGACADGESVPDW